jgi:oxygen-independent coproporphyrinogen III oxidase
MESSMLEYSRALSKEIDNIQEVYDGLDVEISSIFIGGGTPTYLSLEGWNLIKKSIDKLAKIKDMEFTVEGNPGTFDLDKLNLFKTMGVNRLSIGLQAWQNELLKKIGRIHSIEDFLNSYRMARTVGFENINVDLMFGLPEQSNLQWEETLKNIIKLDPEHISCYSLILEEGTPFMKMYEEDKIILSSEDVERNMYDETLSLLRNAGYIHYEISNFSKRNRECRHNMVYWSMGDYIGCGASAHSFFQGKRYSNEKEVQAYINKINEEGSAINEIHENNEKDNIEEFIFMGLRKLSGISVIEFKKRYDRDIYELYGDVINKYIKLGLIAKNEVSIWLTSKGIPISNTVMSDFILDKIDK